MNPGSSSSSPDVGLTALRHAVVERSPLPTAELDGERHIVAYANPAFCRFAGKPQEALVGRPFAETMRESGACLAALDRVYRTGKPETDTESEQRQWSYAIWAIPDGPGCAAAMMMQVTETAKFRRDSGAMNEALLLSSVRQHENLETSDKLNDLLRMEVTHRRRMEDALREKESRLKKELAASQNLQQVSTFVTRDGRLEALYPQIMDAAVALMGSQAASMQLLDDKGAQLKLLAWRGFHSDSAKFWDRVGLESESSCGEALRSHRRIVIADVEDCPFMAGTEDLEHYRKSQIRAVQSTPLVSRAGQTLGMISTHWRDPHRPSRNDLRLFDVLARQAADLIERGLSDQTQRRAEDARRQALAFDEAVMTNMNEGLYTTDRDGLVTFMNPAAEALFGARFEEFSGLRMYDIHCRPDGSPYPVEDCVGFRVLQTGEAVADQEDFFIRKDGGVFPVIYSAAPLRDGNGVTGKVVVFRDVTERKHAQERERVLANELAHRNRNMLAVIQAIVARSLTDAHSPAENRDALMQRLQALAHSQKALESGAFEGAQLADVVRLELDGFSGRYRAMGPDVALNAKASQTFALLIHELATNATKHGALSSPRGSVGIDWSIERGSAEARFRLRWQERGGPPVVRPNRKGFGRVLIEKVAAQELGGKPRIDYAPEGLSYEIETPLSAVAPRAQGSLAL